MSLAGWDELDFDGCFSVWSLDKRRVKLSSGEVARFRSFKVARWQGSEVSKWQGGKVPKFQSCKVAVIYPSHLE